MGQVKLSPIHAADPDDSLLLMVPRGCIG